MCADEIPAGLEQLSLLRIVCGALASFRADRPRGIRTRCHAP